MKGTNMKHKITPGMIMQATRECDILATGCWKLEASDREHAARGWLDAVKKASKMIQLYEKSIEK